MTTQIDSHVGRFWQALLSRGVVQSAAAYAVFGWLLIQVAGVTFKDLGFPPWSVRFVIVAVITGFPFVLVLSWFFESDARGIERDEGQAASGLFEAIGRNYFAIAAAYVAGLGIAAIDLYVPLFPKSGAPTAVVSPESSDEPAASPLEVAPNSVAIMAFEDLDGAPQTARFARGISEDILTSVSRIPGLAVAAKADSWSMSPKAASGDVRRRLEVAYYLEGSVRIPGTSIVVVIRLVDSNTGFNVFTRTFERPLDDFYLIQSDITALVADEMRVSIPDTIRNEVLSPALGNVPVGAYSEYRRGKDFLAQPHTSDVIGDAIGAFRASLSIDADYAAAFAGLCRAYVARHAVDAAPDDLDRAEAACASAIEKAPRIPAVHVATAGYFLHVDLFEDAQRAYESALEIDPKDTDALLGMSRTMREKGEAARAVEYAQRVIEHRPGNWSARNTIGSIYFGQGQYELAARAFQSVVNLDPGNFVALSNVATAEFLSGRFDRAVTLFRRSIDVSERAEAYSNLGLALFHQSRFESALSMYDRAAEISPRSMEAHLNRADALSFLGRDDEARAAYETGRNLAYEVLRAQPRDSVAVSYAAYSEAMLGDVELAGELITKLLDLAPDDPYTYYFAGLVGLRDGKVALAQELFGKAEEYGYARALLQADPHLGALRERGDFLN